MYGFDFKSAIHIGRDIVVSRRHTFSHFFKCPMFGLFCTMLLTGYTKIKFIFVCSVMSLLFLYIYRLCTYGQEKYRERCKKFSFMGCVVAIREASYISQSVLVNANILAYFSFLEKNNTIKRVCPFKEWQALFKMAAMNISFWLYNINNFILCWPMTYNIHAEALSMFLCTWAIALAKI